MLNNRSQIKHNTLEGYQNSLCFKMNGSIREKKGSNQIQLAEISEVKRSIIYKLENKRFNSSIKSLFHVNYNINQI